MVGCSLMESLRLCCKAEQYSVFYRATYKSCDLREPALIYSWFPHLAMKLILELIIVSIKEAMLVKCQVQYLITVGSQQT